MSGMRTGGCGLAGTATPNMLPSFSLSNSPRLVSSRSARPPPEANSGNSSRIQSDPASAQSCERSRLHRRTAPNASFRLPTSRLKSSAPTSPAHTSPLCHPVRFPLLATLPALRHPKKIRMNTRPRANFPVPEISPPISSESVAHAQRFVAHTLLATPCMFGCRRIAALLHPVSGLATKYRSLRTGRNSNSPAEPGFAFRHLQMSRTAGKHSHLICLSLPTIGSCSRRGT
jgi:hypothetical protein